MKFFVHPAGGLRPPDPPPGGLRPPGPPEVWPRCTPYGDFVQDGLVTPRDGLVTADLIKKNPKFAKVVEK